MTVRIRLGFAGIAAAAALGGILLVAIGKLGGLAEKEAPVEARDTVQPVHLSPALRSALERLPHLRRPAVAGGAAGENGPIVLVTFFASWCGPCREELAALKALHKAYAPFGLRIVAVNRFEEFDGLSDGTRLRAYLERLDPPYAVVAGDEKIARAFGGIQRIPTLFLFDREGRPALPERDARGASEGSVDIAALRARIGELL